MADMAELTARSSAETGSVMAPNWSQIYALWNDTSYSWMACLNELKPKQPQWSQN